MTTAVPPLVPIVLYTGETRVHHIRIWRETALRNRRTIGVSTVSSLRIVAPINAGDDAWYFPGGTVRSAAATAFDDGEYQLLAVTIQAPTTAGVARAVLLVDEVARYDARIVVRSGV